MKLLKLMCFMLLASSIFMGQTSSGSGPADTSQISDQIKALQTAIAEQQQQIETLQRQLQEKSTPQVVNASLNTAAPNPAVTQADVEKPKESPLSFRIGGADFTPGGFVDFENVFRTTNSGSTISTNFGAIPFSSQPQGHLTEFRTTGQYSRFNLKIGTRFKGNDVTAYLEGDFNGNDAANVFQVSNPHTLRLRLYWVDLKREHWEFLAGQSWGLETPNRVGISAAPSDLAVTLNEDSNIAPGIPYTRAGLFRLGWHPNKSFAWGVEVQNPQQFTNGAAVVFPSAFATTLTGQFDTGANANIPNLFPDIITKMAWDTSGSHHFHAEVGGLLTSVKIAVQNTGTPAAITPFTTDSKIGGSVLGAFNYEIFKGFRVLANGMYGAGAGRYFVAQGPNAVVAPVTLGPGVFTATPSLVHSGAGTLGLEMQAGKNTQFGLYYGGDYFQRNAFVDVTATTPVQPIIGFGGATVNNAANRAIQEGTFDIVHNFWKDPHYGALVLINQASYLTRAPWFVATTPTPAPKNAHLFMDYLSLRYILP